MAFGHSLHIDLYEVDPRFCKSLDYNYDMLTSLCDYLKMEKQSPPFLFISPVDPSSEKAGLTGFLPLIESGISIHTLTNKRFVTIDIYTCGELDIDKTIEWIKDWYSTDTIEYYEMARGISYIK